MLNNFSPRRKLPARDFCLEKKDKNILNRASDHSNKSELTDQLLRKLNKTVTDVELNCVIDLLKKGANPNTIDSSGNRPIHLAIKRFPNNLRLVRILIKFGAYVNFKNNAENAPLTFSVSKKCYKTSEILIKSGSIIDDQCKYGWTALMVASMVGCLDNVRLLLFHGADVNKCDLKQRTALMFACLGSFLTIIKELLDYGANPGMRDNKQKTAIHYYMKDRSYPNLEIVNELLLHRACFSDLDSFFQLVNEAIEEPPYHAFVYTFIKIQVLATGNSSGIRMCEDLRNFAVNCCAESRLMGGFKVNTRKSVRFLLRECLEGYMPSEGELEGLLPFVVKNKFPIYLDMLRRLLRKPFLIKKFIDTLLFSTSERCVTYLISDVKLIIMSYLSDDDIANFVFSTCIKLKED